MCWLALFLFLSVSTRDKRDEINIFIAGDPCRKEYPILHEYVMIVRKDSPVLIPILMTQSSTVDIRDMPGATWRDVVASVLEQCKEPVALSFLYERIEPHKKAQANKWWKEKIRQTLQINPMHFTHDGRGLWSLNRNAA